MKLMMMTVTMGKLKARSDDAVDGTPQDGVGSAQALDTKHLHKQPVITFRGTDVMALVNFAAVPLSMNMSHPPPPCTGPESAQRRGRGGGRPWPRLGGHQGIRPCSFATQRLVCLLSGPESHWAAGHEW